jgi:hypothetical protein
MKIATFNVNGINGRVPVLLRWLAEAKPDVVCLRVRSRRMSTGRCGVGKRPAITRRPGSNWDLVAEAAADAFNPGTLCRSSDQSLTEQVAISYSGNCFAMATTA